MRQLLVGKKALVIGGSRGIGREIAKKLAAEGASVIVNYNHGQDAAEETVQQIQENGGKAIAIGADISVLENISKLFDEAEKAIGRLDIVISNAGVVCNKPVLEYTPEDYEKTFNTNARAPFFIMQQAGKRINDNGRIVVTSSGGTRMLLSGTTMYLGSKGALEQFARGYSQELADRNITVNIVSPGFTNTDMLGDTEFRHYAASLSPFKRIGEPEEVANMIAFLCTEEASWVTSQNIGVGGGVM